MKAFHAMRIHSHPKYSNHEQDKIIKTSNKRIIWYLKILNFNNVASYALTYLTDKPICVGDHKWSVDFSRYNSLVTLLGPLLYKENIPANEVYIVWPCTNVIYKLSYVNGIPLAMLLLKIGKLKIGKIKSPPFKFKFEVVHRFQFQGPDIEVDFLIFWFEVQLDIRYAITK